MNLEMSISIYTYVGSWILVCDFKDNVIFVNHWVHIPYRFGPSDSIDFKNPWIIRLSSYFTRFLCGTVFTQCNVVTERNRARQQQINQGLSDFFKIDVCDVCVRGLCLILPLTHWGRVMHKCVGNLTSIGSDNGLSPGTNFSEILIRIQAF